MSKIQALFFACILSLSFLGAVVEAAPTGNHPARVLLISSYHPGFPTFFQQINGIKSVFDPIGILLDVEFMDKKRFADAENETYFLEHLVHKLRRTTPYDAVITADDDALLFLLQHKENLFPTQPAVFLGVNNIALAKEQNGRNDITGVIEAVSMRETVQMMLDLQPETHRILSLVDTTPSSLGDLSTLRMLAPMFPHISFAELSLGTHSFDEFADELQKIDNKTAVLLLSAYVDKTGKRMLFGDGLSLIVKNLHRPLYHLWYHGIGDGILGGQVISHQEQGKAAAELVVRIFAGEPVENIKVIEKSPNINIIDYNELKKFNLNEHNLPPNTVFINKPFSLYGQYKIHFWLGAIFFVSQTLLIFFLFSVIKRNKIAEMALRESENRYAGFFNNNHSVLLLINPVSGIIVDSNPAACRFYGYPHEEIVGKEITFFNPLPLSTLQDAMAASSSLQRNHFFSITG